MAVRRCNPGRLSLLWVSALLLSASVSAQPTTTVGSLTLRSDPGDWIGQGGTYQYSAASTPVVGYAPGGRRIEVLFGRTGPSWRMSFEAADGLPLTPGVYPNAQRQPFQDPGHPGLAVYGLGRGCNTLTGTFTVHQIGYRPSPYYTGYDGIAFFWATFEQHCDGRPPALRGEVRYNIDDAAMLPVPVFGPLECSVFVAAIAAAGVGVLRRSV